MRNNILESVWVLPVLASVLKQKDLLQSFATPPLQILGRIPTMLMAISTTKQSPAHRLEDKMITPPGQMLGSTMDTRQHTAPIRPSTIIFSFSPPWRHNPFKFLRLPPKTSPRRDPLFPSSPHAPPPPPPSTHPSFHLRLPPPLPSLPPLPTPSAPRREPCLLRQRIVKTSFAIGPRRTFATQHGSQLGKRELDVSASKVYNAQEALFFEPAQKKFKFRHARTPSNGC